MSTYLLNKNVKNGIFSLKNSFDASFLWLELRFTDQKYVCCMVDSLELGWYIKYLVDCKVYSLEIRLVCQEIGLW